MGDDISISINISLTLAQKETKKILFHKFRHVHGPWKKIMRLCLIKILLSSNQTLQDLKSEKKEHKLPIYLPLNIF